MTKNWAVKIRFLLISNKMLKNIAEAPGVYTAKCENMASYSTDYILFLIRLTSLAIIEK